MSIFRVLIGKESRRNDLISPVEIIVSVTDAEPEDVYKVQGFFQKRYQGFSVRVTTVEVITLEMPKDTPVSKPVEAKEDATKTIETFIENMIVTMHPSERDKCKQADGLRRQSDDLFEEVKSSIRDRIVSMSPMIKQFDRSNVIFHKNHYGEYTVKINKVDLTWPIVKKEIEIKAAEPIETDASASGNAQADV